MSKLEESKEKIGMTESERSQLPEKVISLEKTFSETKTKSRGSLDPEERGNHQVQGASGLILGLGTGVL